MGAESSGYLARIARQMEASESRTMVQEASGNVANAAAVATIAAVAGSVAHITGFSVTGTGATAGLPVQVTVAGLAGDDLVFIYAAAAGVLVANQALHVEFPFPIPAVDDETDIVVTCPALGAGNTHNACVAYGYYV